MGNINVQHYWDVIDDVTRLVIDDIKSSMKQNERTKITFDNPIDDIYEIWIDENDNLCMSMAASSLNTLNQCNIDVILRVAQVANTLFS